MANYAVSCTIGSRRVMEDTYTALTNFKSDRCGPDDPVDFYGIYDGHGGSFVAGCCKERMHQKYMENFDYIRNISHAINSAFIDIDTEVTMEQMKFRPKSGSTAVVVIVNNNDVTVAHAGDSRAVICSGDNIFATEDHKPNRPDEMKRVGDSGGFVLNVYGTFRVENLAVSRSIGDEIRGVIAQPEIFEHKRCAQDEFIVIGSDGLWDTVTVDEAVKYVRRVRDASASHDHWMQASADGLMRLAIDNGSRDNITVLIVDLSFAKRL